ncbi:TPA: hypothetical protein N0F65_001879 [Lagenidium giganteum]|uniref:Uncharacterized protein n=1 Tax=Lagenidium giganteum TaxID=4803 RepID=A0AAV2Z2R5_9STRA|nr:TPA: hypothetical protein N0F65_001879 [Lagenidium giganteum]
MKGNLVLLMSIRETQSDIERDWYQLQRYHQEMQALGIPIPPECNAILDDAPPNEEGPAAADSAGRTNDSDGRDDSESSSDSSSDD